MATARFSYDSYQDVRHNLFLYSLPFLIAAGFYTYNVLLPPPWRASITGILTVVSEHPLWKGGSGLAVFIAIAYLLTEILQVHDQFYDRYLVRWRRRYATDFILPRLVQPFASLLNYRFHEEAEQNLANFEERLFYPFVGDRNGLLQKDHKNVIIRFYEVVTVYWLTQLNELILLSVLLGSVAFHYFGPGTAAYQMRLLEGVFLLCLLLLLNRAWVRAAREKVRRATEEEILAIHNNFKQELQKRLTTLCTDYALPYGG